MRGALGLICATAAGFYLAFSINSLHQVGNQRVFALFDDAMISMRYARNLAEGHGLVWYAGAEPIEGYTNFLWTIWMAFLHLLLPDRLVGTGVVFSGALLLIVGIWLSYTLARKLAPQSTVAPLAAAFLTAICYPLAFWTLRGLEVGLVSVIFTCALVIACDAFHEPSKRRLLGLGIVFSLGLLTRPDTVVVAITTFSVLMLVGSNAQRRATGLYGIGPIVITGLLLCLFRLTYYDALLPNTYALKVEGFSLYRRVRRGLLSVGELTSKGGYGVIAAFGVVGLLRGLRHRRPQHLLVVTTIVGVFAYSIYVGGDAWEEFKFANRYTSAVLPALFALSGAGLATVYEHWNMRERKSWTIPMTVVAITCSTLVLATLTLPRMDALKVVPNTFSKFLLVGALSVVVPVLVCAVIRVRGVALTAAVVMTTVGLAMAVNGREFSTWHDSKIARGSDDYKWANYGNALRQYTTPKASILVTSAGNISYFLDHKQPVVDGLGKMDPVIAHHIPRRPDFPPGHQKWDYYRSIGELRPDVISQLFAATDDDIRMILSAGYEPIGDAFVRKDSEEVNRDGLREWLAAHPH